MACSEKCVISACHCWRSIAPTPARRMRQMSHSALKRIAENGDRPSIQCSLLSALGQDGRPHMDAGSMQSNTARSETVESTKRSKTMMTKEHTNTYRTTARVDGVIYLAGFV